MIRAGWIWWNWGKQFHTANTQQITKIKYQFGLRCPSINNWIIILMQQRKTNFDYEKENNHRWILPWSGKNHQRRKQKSVVNKVYDRVRVCLDQCQSWVLTLKLSWVEFYQARLYKQIATSLRLLQINLGLIPVLCALSPYWYNSNSCISNKPAKERPASSHTYRI
mgnify:CR=1 FL=1